jgi:hypothetical protein
MKLASVNTGLPREVAWHGRTVITGETEFLGQDSNRGHTLAATLQSLKKALPY